jgi:hypothetical protein
LVVYWSGQGFDLKKSSVETEKQLESEGSRQAELGELLQKERSPEAVHAVEAILKDARSIDEKIHLIRELDKSGTGYISRRDYASPKAKEGESAVFDGTSIEIPYFDDLRAARTAIKKALDSSTFWHYLIKEFSRLRKFGDKSHILSSGFFFFRLRFNPDLPKLLIDRVQKETAHHLVPGLHYILQHAWLFLGKDEYNALNLLNVFVLELVHTNLAGLDFTNRYLIDRLRRLESLYLSIRAIPDGMNLIFGAVESAYRHLTVLDEKHPRLERYIHLLFLQDYTLPSFANFILGANMLKLRRFVGYGDLIVENPPPVISKSDWECPAELYRLIRKHIWEQEQELEPLLRYYDEIFRKVNYMPVTAQGGLDYSPLAAFWDTVFGTGDFASTSGNISSFLQQACDLLLGPVRSFLCGEIRISGGRAVRIFQEQVFSPDLFRIESVKDSLEKLVEIMPSFPRDRFIQLKQSKRGSLPNEAAIIQKVSILLSAARALSNRLIAVMKGRLTTAERVDEYPPVDSLMIRKGGFFLPFENEVLVKPDSYAGLRPPEAVHRTIAALLTLSVLLEDHETSSLLRREEKIKEKILEIGRNVHRLANASRFQQFRDEFHLDRFGL